MNYKIQDNLSQPMLLKQSEYIIGKIKYIPQQYQSFSTITKPTGPVHLKAGF